MINHLKCPLCGYSLHFVKKAYLVGRYEIQQFGHRVEAVDVWEDIDSMEPPVPECRTQGCKYAPTAAALNKLADQQMNWSKTWTDEEKAQ